MGDGGGGGGGRQLHNVKVQKMGGKREDGSCNKSVFRLADLAAHAASIVVWLNFWTGRGRRDRS